ncbi:hypothetical protein QFZ91_000090 [Paraburkholderia sp. JPY419]
MLAAERGALRYPVFMMVHVRLHAKNYFVSTKSAPTCSANSIDSNKQWLKNLRRVAWARYPRALPVM